MKIKNLLSSIILVAFIFPQTVFGQSKWVENDDMYFSKKDREKIYASVDNLEQSSLTTEQSEYAASHNFNSPTVMSTTAGSPTVQPVGNADSDNNQYFIKDYSIKNKADNEVKTYSGINSNTGFQSGINVIFTLGSSFGSPYGRNRYGYYNPFDDPFSPYYDPFYRYGNSNYYASYRYNPWRYNNYGYGNNNGFGNNNGYYNSANWCPTNGYTNYSNNVRNEVRYRNGRKIISGSRNASSTSRSQPNRVATSDRPVKNVNTNGRSSSRASRNSYRKYPNSAQNRSAYKPNSSTAKRANTYNRTNGNSNRSRSNWNNSSNQNRSNSYRSSGSSSGSRSSSYSRPSSGGSRSSGSRSSSGGSRSTGKRKN
ncbi:MAG: hypothetical protein L3J29_09725 [Cyclobacteriaceae bacterium]|nr:hypothetical protein [Cyclobacteriaceae bacterium]